MFKKIIALTFAAAILAGCASRGIDSTSPVPPASTPEGQAVQEVIVKVQDYTTKVCGFVPTAQTILNIGKLFGLKSADGIIEAANLICNAVTTKSSVSRTVEGKRVRAAPMQVCKGSQCVPIYGTRVR